MNQERFQERFREEWLNTAVRDVTAQVFTPAQIIVPVEDIQVSVGFCKGQTALGQCWSREASDKGRIEIFISPIEDDAIEVLGTLAHELNHAVDNCKSGHRAPFKRRCEKIGLIWEMQTRGCHTESTPDLIETFQQITKNLGAYPHAKITPKERLKKQTTRMKKLECTQCGAVLRASQQVLNGMTSPTVCPVCRDESLEF
jgi:rubrerythrin|tara:strand:+ start:2871 stop:3470 length:600 start_codon:yes stop_codon:yes gene_type:complete